MVSMVAESSPPAASASGSAPYYQAEFRIRAEGRFDRHNVSCFHVSPDGRLFTLTVQTAQARWEADGQLREQARRMGASLRVR